MKSYRSSVTFVTVHLFFHELLPFVQNSFSRVFLPLLSNIWMKVGGKLLYEELQIKFHFCHSWPTFSWVIDPLIKILFPDFFSLCFHIYQMKVGRKLSYEELQIKIDFHHSWPTSFSESISLPCLSVKIRFPDFSSLCCHTSEWKLEGSFHMKPVYRWDVKYKRTDALSLSDTLSIRVTVGGHSTDFSHTCFDILRWDQVPGRSQRLLHYSHEVPVSTQRKCNYRRSYDTGCGP